MECSCDTPVFTGGKRMNIPNHVAIILDGNGRWAKSKGMPAITDM